MKLIPKEKLETGGWYLGIGRGSNVAWWSGNAFHYIEFKFSTPTHKVCDIWGKESGAFQPFEKIDDLKYGQVCRYKNVEDES